MKNLDEIDFSKLFGFDALSDELSSGVDFQDETIAGKLGAKVGKGGSEAPVTLFEAIVRINKPAS